MPSAFTHGQQLEWQQHAPQRSHWGGVKRRVELCAGVFALLIQLAVWGRTAAALSLRGHGHQAALVIIQSCSVMTTLLLPYAAWRRNRVWLIGLLRVSMVLVPSHRSSKEGTAVLLHHAATPGLGGMLKDYLRVALGTRVLLQTVAAIILQQPPLAVLLQQCIISAMVSNTSGYCACPLLDNPLAAQRLAWLSRGLDAVPLFTVPFTSAAMLHRQGNPRCICMALLYMHQVVVGVLIPTVLAAYTSSALEEPATPQHRQRQQQQPVWGQLCGLASRAEELWQHANSMVQEVCTGAGMPGVQLALAAWLLAGNLWMIAVAMAERDA